MPVPARSLKPGYKRSFPLQKESDNERYSRYSHAGKVSCNNTTPKEGLGSLVYQLIDFELFLYACQRLTKVPARWCHSKVSIAPRSPLDLRRAAR